MQEIQIGSWSITRCYGDEVFALKARQTEEKRQVVCEMELVDEFSIGFFVKCNK